MNITRISNLMFQSNPHREREMARLRELERQRQAELARLRAEADLIQRIDRYPALDDSISTKVAGFLSQFTCAIQNDSEHNIMEFFGDEKTASDLRKDLSPECQADSKKLREMVQNLEEVKDPVRTLIVANRMQKFAPKEGILDKEQQKSFVDGIKEVLSTTIRNADLDKFAPEDKASIIEMVQKIEASDSVKFGIEAQLKKLVDKLNRAKLNIGFIPPVQVKNLDMGNAIKILKK
jgi:hypothetical protein